MARLEPVKHRRRKAQRAVLHLKKMGQQEPALAGGIQQQDTRQHFVPTPLLAEACGYYHTNEKIGARPHSTVHVAVHKAASLSCTLLPAFRHAPAGLSLVLPFGEGCQVLVGEEEPQRQVPLCCINNTAALPKCTMKYQHGETQDSAPPAPTSFLDEAELRSQSMNTRKDEHTCTKSCHLKAWKIA